MQNYQQRIRRMIANRSKKASSGELARECINATRSGLDRLAEADNIYVVGDRAAALRESRDLNSDDNACQFFNRLKPV